MMKPAPFRNEPFYDFSTDPARRAMAEAIAAVGAELGREYPLWIDGKPVRAGKTFKSMNPSESDQVVAVVHQAGPEQVEAAVRAAGRAYESWRWVPAEEKAALFMRGAHILRKRRA